MQINGGWVDKPTVIKEAVLQHFKGRFAEPCLPSPNLDGVSFKALSLIQSEMLVEAFKEEERVGRGLSQADPFLLVV